MYSTNTQSVVESVVNLLLISPIHEDHLQLRTILRDSNWLQRSARTQAEALGILKGDFSHVVICEENLPDGTWRDLLVPLQECPAPPVLVVTSRFADERLWSEALNLGAYNVLAKPLNSREVLHVVGSAWLQWKRDWEHERPLARTA